MPHPFRDGAWCAVLCVSVLECCGCSDGDAREQLDLARESVQASLEAWKQGEQVVTLKYRPDPIEFYDDDWQRSARLVEFELIQTYLDTDGTPRCAVGLTVQYGSKSPEHVQVTYQVVYRENQIVIAQRSDVLMVLMLF